MIDYSREEYEERDRANNDYWAEKDLKPSKADLEESGTDDVITKKASDTPTCLKRIRKRIPIKR